ncbi:diaminopimelate epimerase [Clostridiisalibacter paucivorans]|uniref:diaminopimelate epimerase n=1 Tax=Clostridiisalibacter paucivorans TaxID=408753 RepID=UPI000B0E20FF|nr:diaminopimelate epimerase [Clostridiisalibacter paucivorans]
MINFEKLEGAGNDFIIFNGIDGELPNYNLLAKKVCDRHFGVGADGMMIVCSSQVADIKMVFYNGDGTEAPMCGNGIRCFAKYIFDNNIVINKSFTVETLAGIMKVKVFINNDLVHKVRVNMGSPDFNSKSVPINTDKDNFINEKIEIDGIDYRISVFVMGSVHGVIFIDNIEDLDIKDIGPKIERHELFPEGINVNFCKIIDDNNIEVLTWERGVGQTLACGTGATATAVISSKLYGTNDKVNIHLLGGVVEIENKNNILYMTGPAKRICKGEYYCD